MTDYTTLSNDDLSRVVAERLGHRVIVGAKGTLHLPDDGPWQHCRFAESMDACLAPGGPVEWLRGRKWFPEILDFGDRFGVRIYPSHDVWMYRGKSLAKEWADTLPRAFCLAFLAATDDGGAA